MRKTAHQGYLKAFGESVKNHRLKKGLTQAQLAIDCDFDVSVISRIERGVINTSISNVYIISKALSVDMWELFRFEFKEE